MAGVGTVVARKELLPPYAGCLPPRNVQEFGLGGVPSGVVLRVLLPMWLQQELHERRPPFVVRRQSNGVVDALRPLLSLLLRYGCVSI